MGPLLASLHPGNHLLVQELALAGALAGSLTASPDGGSHEERSNDLFKAAERLALSKMAYEEMTTFAPSHPTVAAAQAPWTRRGRLGPVPQRILARRVSDLLQLESPPSPTDKAARGRLPMMAPMRFIALYAPHCFLPPLPAYVHDPVSYDEAVHHLAVMQRVLQPLGFQLSLDGRTRRGCPCGATAEFLLTLTREATDEVVAAGASEEVDAAPHRRGERVSGTGWHASSYAPSPAASRGVGPRAADTLFGELATAPCTAADVVTVKDTVSAPILHRYRRAIQALHNSGHLIAGAASTRVYLRRADMQDGLAFTARYDPAPTTGHVLPFRLTDVPVLRRARLHRVVLRAAPWDCWVTRRFFRTGPAAFTVHAVLKALEKGLELNPNGLFARSVSAETGESSCRRVLLRTEMDVFTAIGLPYVDPIGRGIYCQQRGITTDT